MPHKDAAAALADRRTPLAALLGAVNCLIRSDDGWVGDNTDGPGLVAALRRGDRFEPEGRRCLVVGAGGAARAVIAALAGAGASEVVVVNRSTVRAAAAASMAGPVGRVGQAAEAPGCDLVVNATPLGMERSATAAAAASSASDTESLGADPPAWPIDPVLLHAGQMVVDLVYHPLVTPWLAAAADQGAQVANGLGMLVHQAALQLTAWTGLEAPVEAMWTAVGDRVRGEGGTEGPVGRALST
jgi:shikimate dehydrogenase